MRSVGRPSNAPEYANDGLAHEIVVSRFAGLLRPGLRDCVASMAESDAPA